MALAQYGAAPLTETSSGIETRIHWRFIASDSSAQPHGVVDPLGGTRTRSAYTNG
jgi:hypothetical protein